MLINWRGASPTKAEMQNPSIIGWGFRGRLLPENYEMIHKELPLKEKRPFQTTDLGIIVEVFDWNDEQNQPLWVRWREYLFAFCTVRGEWCPIRTRRPEKNWSTCPYDVHSNDCDCGGVGGDR